MANCSWRTFFGFGSLIGATALLIVAMTGLGWRVYPTSNDSVWHIGLKAYRLDFKDGDSKTGNLKDVEGKAYENKAGDIPLGFGVTSCFFAIIGMVLILIHLFRPNTPRYRNFRRIGMFLNFLCGIFTLLAIILYAKKFYVGYSFILYIFSAFLCYIGTTFLLSHAFTGNASFTSSSRKTLTTTTTTSATPAPATHEMGVYNENQA